MGRNENKLSQIAYNDIKWNENKALWSKKIRSLLEQIGLRELQMKVHYADIGIVNMIRQRLKDIELQRWLRPVSNVVLMPCRTQLIESNSTLARQ